MEDKKILDKVNPERREFLKKVTKGAFIIPTVISVMMLDQKLNLSSANAQSNDFCLSLYTLISTPAGHVPITDLRPGMPVYTQDMDGNKTVMPIELATKVSVPESHIVCHLVLKDGRELFVSGGHPTADGRLINDLNPGDVIDGAKLKSIERVPYSGGYTYDLLPAGDTGHYWANGVLLGSTLSASSGIYIREELHKQEHTLYS